MRLESVLLECLSAVSNIDKTKLFDFVSYFCLLSTELLDFVYSAPVYLHMSAQDLKMPVLDQAGRWPKDFTGGFSHAQSSGSVVSKVRCARQSIGL